MFSSWFDLTMLAVESQSVIGLRMMKFAGGGLASLDEAQLMISEKIKASTRATNYILMGGTADIVVREYRRIVSANASRLSSKTAA